MNAVEYCLLHGLKVAGPEHPALLSAGETLSYGALEQRVSQFAVGLREAGVGIGDRVGMLMLDTPDIVAMHLAAMAAGAVAVAMSSRASPEELEQILAIVRPAALVIDGEFAALAASAIAKASPQTKLIRREHELAAWKAKPAWGIVSSSDTTINPEVERFGYERAQMKVTEIDSSHLVMLSHPTEVVGVIREALASVTAPGVQVDAQE